MQIHQVVFAAVALGVPASARAQDWAAPSTRDTVLRAFVTEALARNHGVHEQEATLRAATERVRPAGALPDPMLSVGVMDLTLPGFAFNQSDFSEVNAELAQGFRGRGEVAHERASQAAHESPRATLDVRRRDVVSSAATTIACDSHHRARHVTSPARPARGCRPAQHDTVRDGARTADRSAPGQACPGLVAIRGARAPCRLGSDTRHGECVAGTWAARFFPRRTARSRCITHAGGERAVGGLPDCCSARATSQAGGASRGCGAGHGDDPGRAA